MTLKDGLDRYFAARQELKLATENLVKSAPYQVEDKLLFSPHRGGGKLIPVFVTRVEINNDMISPLGVSFFSW